MHARTADESQPQSRPAGDAPGLVSPPGRPPLAPPPLAKARKRIPTGIWQGRTHFDGLFVADDGILSAMPGGLNEKVEFFREKLKLTEARIWKFREAWAVRDRELDTLEALHAREKGRAEQNRQLLDTANENLNRLQEFIETKKREFTAYGEKAAKLLNEQLEIERNLRHELEKLKREFSREKDDMQVQLAAAKSELETHNKAVKKLKALTDAQREALAERDAQIDALSSEVASSSEQAARLRESDEETRLAIHKRDDAIRKLKAALENAKTRLTDFEANHADRSEELDEVAGRRQAVEAELTAAHAELREVGEELAEAKQSNRELEEEAARLREQMASAQTELVESRASDGGGNTQVQARLARTLGVATKLTDDLEDRTDSILADLSAAGVDAGDATEDVGEILRRIRKALGIALRVVDEDK